MRWIDIKVKDLKTKINDQCVTDAKEELIAQSGACMLMEYFNLNNVKTTELTQAYLKGWLSKLNSEPSILTQAMRQSTKAVKTMLGN